MAHDGRRGRPIIGLLPHELHHIGLLAGTALVAGLGGTALFGALGLRASIAMLVRRFGSWMAPALGLLVFAATFSLSAFVIGPAISGTGGGVNPGPIPTWTTPATTPEATEHPRGPGHPEIRSRLDSETRKWLLDNPGCVILPRSTSAKIGQEATGDIERDQHGQIVLSRDDHDFIGNKAETAGTIHAPAATEYRFFDSTPLP